MSFDDLGISPYRPAFEAPTGVPDPARAHPGHGPPAVEPQRVDPAATAAEQQGAGERFGAYAGAAPRRRGEPPLPGGETKAPVRPEAQLTPVQQIDAAAERLAAASPAAQEQLAQFRAAGGTFIDAGDQGFYRAGPPPVIGINTRHRDGRPTTELERMQTIAHELGHDNYARTEAARDPYRAPSHDGGGITDAQIELRRYHNYVTRNAQRGLTDEAHATLFNARVRDEMFARTGRDIGVAGYARREDVQLSREAIAEYFARLVPSTDPNTNYRGYYQRPYREHYDRYHAPGVEGMQDAARAIRLRALERRLETER